VEEAEAAELSCPLAASAAAADGELLAEVMTLGKFHSIRTDDPTRPRLFDSNTATPVAPFTLSLISPFLVMGKDTSRAKIEWSLPLQLSLVIHLTHSMIVGR